MPLGAWRRLPRSVRERLRGGESDEPWIVPAAVERLDELIEPTWSILEFGSGASTAWFASRAARVVSFEDDLAWHDIVRARTAGLGSARCDLRHLPLGDFPAAAAQLPAGTFDLVVIDGNEQPGATRADCAAAARHLIKPGGLVVVDDSDVRELQPIIAMFEGWTLERFVGVKPRPLMAVETSILHRPATDPP